MTYWLCSSAAVLMLCTQGCASWYLFEFRDSATNKPIVAARVANQQVSLMPTAIRDQGNTDFHGNVILKSAPVSHFTITTEQHGFQHGMIEVLEMSLLDDWFPVFYTGDDDVSIDIDDEWIECRLTRLRTRFGHPQLPSGYRSARTSSTESSTSDATQEN